MNIFSSIVLKYYNHVSFEIIDGLINLATSQHSKPQRFDFILNANQLTGRVGKILTARDFPCGKSRDFLGWEIPSKFGKLGNTGQYLIKILNFIVFL